MDINEFAPVFNPQFYQRRISETALVGEPVIQVFATDNDSAKNSSIFYNITGGNVNGTFSIDPENGTIVLLKSLDYETQRFYELHVQASDGEFNSGANVSIQVVDYNDNSPEFRQANFSFYVPENVTTGNENVTVPENVTERYFVGSVTAGDRDSDNNAHISYSIPSLRDHDKFWINTSSGEIYTNGVLDYETTENYAILVEAHDSGHPPRMAVALVNIAITDVNDNSPEFVDRYLQVNVSEASTVGTQIVCLSATDRDSMQYARTSFNISKGNINSTFSVTDEGVVILQRHLDRETMPTYNLTIDAADLDSSQLKSDKSAVVIIYVEDINDNHPVFTKNLYSAKMLENVPIGHTVINVTAHDKDIGSNGQVTYSLVESPWATDNLANNIFTVHGTNGTISTLKKLKPNALQVEYKFQVKASDKGIPSLESFTNVLVTVEDTNDSPPVFTVCPENRTVQQPEVGNEMFHVSTTDGDHGSNANVTYSILDEQFPKNCTLEKGTFQIRHNGSIYSVMKLKANSNYSINISATDGVYYDFCSVDVYVMAEPDTDAPKTGKLYFS